MRGARRASIALAVSVALHLLVLALFIRRVALPSEPAPQSNESVQVEIIEGPRSPPPRAPKRRPEREKAIPPEPPREIARAEPAPAPKPPSPPAPSPSASEPPAGQPGGPASDAPRTPANMPEAGGGVATSEPGLVPAVPGTGASQPNPYSAFSKGRTLHNGEGEEPDPEALAQVNAERAKRKVEGFFREDLGIARAQPGVVDSYFMGVGKALQKYSENPPKFTEGRTFVDDVVSAWTPGASQYGRTGNPYGPGQQPLGSADRDAMNPIANAARERPDSLQAEVWRKQQAWDRFREFADGRFGTGIVALVEIRQARDGGFLGAALIRSSGNRMFDEHVLKTAPVAIAAAPSPQDRVNGAHDDGMRTLWSFEGKVVFTHRKKAGQMNADDALGLAAMSVLSGLTGGFVPSGITGFDETTGEVEFVDLTHPRFTCKVKLLRVY